MTYRIYVGVPSGGAPLEQSNDHTYLASFRHQVFREPSCVEGLNFNTLWCNALNGGMTGQYTHFAMSHADIRVMEDEPGMRWADRLIEEMEKHDADFISTPNAIKDHRGLTSSGIGDPDDLWNPYRRFTLRDLAKLPVTFDAQAAGYGSKFLIHNEALCLFDLRKPLWYETNPDGTVRCDFNVVERIQLRDGAWRKDQLTEDWKLSRDLWQMGARTVLSTRVRLVHFGLMGWENKGDFGTYRDGDENTAHKWRPCSTDRDLQPRELVTS